MPTRSSRTAWDGSFEEGSGQVEFTSSGLATFDVSFPKRASDDGGGATNPEELLAASHSSCFTMQFTALLGQADATVHTIETTADVTLAPDPNGGFQISKIALKTSGEVDGVDAEQFAKIAEDAKANCPISKALAGVADITLEASLDS